MSRFLHVTFGLITLTALLIATSLTNVARAASVGGGGYTNDFGVLPPVSDWSTYTIAGTATDIANAAQLDAAVQAVSASSITAQLVSDTANPPAAGALGQWSSSGFYAQTRPTGVGGIIVMCTLVNNLGTDALGVNIGYDFAQVAPLAEEVDGHRAYYSLTGAAGSWTVIPQFSSAAPGRLTTTLSLFWPSGSSLYILWADDNSLPSSPDTAMQIDNFSATAIPGTQVPVAITNQPQSQTVGELQPVTFTVGLSGYLPPTVQWYSNNVAIPNATNTTYTIAAVQPYQNGLGFKAIAQNVASNVTYTATSSVAVLTVIADLTPPTLVTAVGSGGGLVSVVFSEPITLATATNLANYSITNLSGALQITNATLASDRTNLSLFTSSQAVGDTYTLTVNGVRDVSASGNVIATNSQISFVALNYTTTDIGSAGVTGSFAPNGNGFDVSGAGSGIGGTSDQFLFGSQLRVGDFDIKVRVANLNATDPWTEAALMARETYASNSIFAAAVTAPLITGSFFQSRATTGGSATTSGTFPANMPDMWLRLKRAGNVFSGYAGVDGQTWVQLGSNTLSVGGVYLGFAITSHNVSQSAAAQFRDYANTETNATVVARLNFVTEPLSAAARTCPIVISEIMYDYNPTGTNNLEFIELYNSNPFFEDISGYSLAGDIDFTFPPNTIIQGGAFLVLARDATAVQNAYGISGVLQYGITQVTTNIAGGVTNVTTNVVNSLNNSGGSIQLRSDSQYRGILLQVDYSSNNPWPVGANGTGHSLVLARASYGQNDPYAWDTSDRVGGSPGKAEPLRVKSGVRAVVINEVLAHTDLPLLDYIELYNYSSNAVDISGCYLSDSASTNKFKVPPATVLPARGAIAFDENQLGFRLSQKGEHLYFRSADATRMLDAMQYEAQENGVAFGRYPDGAPEFYRLTARTPGATNAPPLVDDIVINEIMYSPISEEVDDEYVELYNKGTNAVNLAGWKFTQGIDFKFPPNSVLLPDHYFVVAKNYNNLRAHYSNLDATNTFGDFSGTLSHNGERVALGKPEEDYTTNGSGVIKTNITYLIVEEVTYGIGGRWGHWANQGGSSLELIDPRSNHRLAYNWGDSDETSKAPWTQFETTGILDSPSSGNGASGTQGGTPIDRLEVVSLGEGEYLLDDIDARYPGNATNLISNSTFESGGISPWTPQGNHINTTIETSGFTGARSMHVRATGNGDTGANRVRHVLTLPLTAGQVFTIKGYARWLHGWPETTLRIKGGYLEAYTHMTLPSNLGTPGARNSIARTNAAPAIYAVTHTPVLPQVGDGVVVLAGVQDPDGVANVNLFYRVDSAAPPAYTALAMNDNGTGGDAVAGDGIYSATIPPQTSGTMITFYAEATDTRNATNRFPANAITVDPDGQRHECLVRWGDPMPVLSFAIYRMWLSQANVTSFINRPPLSNQDVDGTMIVGNSRPIYNMFSHYSNSPYHQNFGSPAQNSNPVSAPFHMDVHLPLDDKYLGTENFNKIHSPGNGAFEDNNWLREQTAYWFARKAGQPYLYRRFLAMYVNGIRKSGGNAGPDALMEDTQRPGGELISEFFPDETSGRLYKIQPWFEFDDNNVVGGGSAAFDNKLWCTMMPALSTNAHKITRYRQNWLSRSVNKTANDYTNVIALINAAGVPTTSPLYWQNLSALIDIEQWAHIFAVEHAMGNWDSFGGVNAQNMYGYKPDHGKWKLMIWDANITVNNATGNSGGAGPGTTSNQPGGNLFDVQSGQDPNMAAMEAFPPFRRAWWRAYKELTVGPNAPMLAANCEPLIDAKYAAFRANGLNPPGAAASVKGFLSTARSTIAAAVAVNDYNGGFTSLVQSVTASVSNLVTINGSAAFDVTEIDVNGTPWPITWTGLTTWTATVPVTNGSPITVTGYDKNHQIIGTTNTVNVTYSLAAAPDPRDFILFNEIMYNPSPTAPGSEYVELYNRHTNYTFNIGGWRINGIDYTFPAGTYFPPRSFIVLVKDRVAFSIVYGANVAIFGEYAGTLQGNGETLTLVKPAATTNDVELVIDRVRYESTAPWSTNANNSGSSLQLIDPNQDNSRVGNWASAFTPAAYTAAISTPAAPRDGWRFFSASGSIGTGDGGGQMRLLVYLGEVGSALIDDLSVVAGTNAAVGYNYVTNGNFETPFLNNTNITNNWNFGTNYTNSLIVGDLVHAGSGALKIVGASPGNANAPTYNRAIYQWLSPAPLVNSTNTLSFWYWATNSATNLLIRIRNSTPLTTGGSGTNINIFITPTNYVPPALISGATNSVSPGSNNVLSTTMPPFPPLWINEVQAENITGILDSYGQRDPWIEIYNTSTNAVTLEGLYLTSTYTNYTNWAFPVGSSIGPTQFLVVFCDGQPAQTSNTEYHTSFRLPAVSGSVALSRLFTNAPQVMDYVNYDGLHPDRSYGSFPDGQPFDRQEFYFVTPRGTNNGTSAPLLVFINEWMAANTNALVDPADNDHDDWFELYNPTTNTVDIAGYYLTDTLTNKFKYLITTNGPHTIAGHGFLLVWADNETGQNTSGGVPRADLHVNFQLAKAAEAIGLYAADGSLIDAITFTNQTDDISMGRYPDGGPNIYYMTNTTPRLPNVLSGTANVAPVLDPIGGKVMFIGQTLSFTATATDSDLPPQILTFSLDAVPPAGASISGSGAFTFTPVGTGTKFIGVRVTDNGSPPASDFEIITVEVLEQPGFTSSVRNGNNFELTWGTRAGKSYAVEYKADLNAPDWTPLWTNTAIGDSLSFTNATTNGPQRFFRIRTGP